MRGESRRLILGIRPTDFKLGDEAPPALPRIRVTTDVVEELGGVSNLLFPIDAQRVVTDATRAAEEAGAEDEGTLLADDQRARFCAAIHGRRSVGIGEEVELAIDNDHLHFFDLRTGDVLGDPARVPAAAV